MKINLKFFRFNFRLYLILIMLIGVLMFFSYIPIMKDRTKKIILFLCVHNTFRSQIAEAYFNKFANEKNLGWQAKSAGFLKADKINEKAVVLMKEEGIDISDKKPKLVTNEMIDEAEKIIVVCEECEKEGICINLPKYKDIEYWRLKNPAEIELEKGREIRDEIKNRVIKLVNML